MQPDHVNVQTLEKCKKLLKENFVKNNLCRLYIVYLCHKYSFIEVGDGFR